MRRNQVRIWVKETSEKARCVCALFSKEATGMDSLRVMMHQMIHQLTSVY